MPFFLVCLVGLLVSIRASLASSPVVSGQVRLPDGSAVAGAQVVLFDVADLRRGPVGQATTDEAGQFALPLTAGGGAFMLPQEVGLGQNYPNPFNPSTLIPYQLSAPSSVRLEVFNVLGQRVATLVDGQQAAGAYGARWDGTDALGRAAASGVYFYRLTVAGAHWTGKMVLVDGQAGVPLGGARVTMVSMADGSSGRYGLVVSAAGRVAHVDSDFSGGVKPVVIELAAEPKRRGKVVASLEGLLGDVNADERVDLDDGLLVAMYSVDPALLFPHHGLMTLGDVNCDGRVELEDAGLLATYVANPSDAAVASLRMGQPGGYSLDPVTEVMWGSILGNEQADATVAQILDEVPVLLSGVLPDDDGEDRLYLGIDRAWWTQQGGKQLYESLKQRFPATPIHVEPSIGVIRQAGKVARWPTTTALRQVAPVTQFGPPMSFTESPAAALPDHSKAQHVVGTIDVPHDVVVGSVSVAVDISHTARNDLIVDLVAPSGVVVPLYRGIRHGVSLADDLVGTIATTDALQGQPAQGTWQIRVGDYGQNDTGTVNAWTLTVTPAEDGGVTEEPVNVLLETFQDGLNDWSTTAWEAAALDTDTDIPGEGAGNIVAKTEGCSICFLTLKTPVDLSDHDEVTLSFYRWMDPGTMSNEFLGIDVANNGQYQRLKTWDRPHADGQWHLETFTLSGDQIGESFTLRFFGITHNMFTTFAVDNVMIAAAPGSVVITPDTPSTGKPDLTVTETTATPATVAPQERLSLETTIQNSNAAAGTQTITIYRHTQITDTPKQGGAVTSIVGAILQTDATRSIRTTTSAPETPGTYYYYSCINELENEENTANNCVETPATVTVQETEQTTNQPDLTVVYGINPSRTVQPGETVTLYPRIRNVGTGQSPAADLRIYRHTAKTTTPQTGGTEHPTTARVASLAPNKSAVIVVRTSAAQTAGTYYYYVCVDRVENETKTTNNCTTDPATITTQGTSVTPTTRPDLIVLTTTASPTAVQSTDTITIRASVKNNGDAPANPTDIRLYRHTARTTTPTVGGVREVNTTRTTTLAPNAAVTVTSTHRAPSVTTGTTYYYYLCAAALPGEQVTDNNCSAVPAAVAVSPKPQTSQTPNYDDLPMGGDWINVSSPSNPDFFNAGTITLGGLETTTGVQGFVVSAHVVAPPGPDGLDDFTSTDTIIGHRSIGGTFRDLFGKVFRMPKLQRREGAQTPLLTADAAFVAYPHPSTPDCSYTYKEYDQFSRGREYCLDVGSGEYLERVAPLRVRGADNAVHPVIGSAASTEGLAIQFFGARSGEALRATIETVRLLTYSRNTVGYVSVAFGTRAQGGDSGAPVYTVPDAAGNVRIVGILDASTVTGEGDNRREGITFSAWSDVEAALDLKPLSAPASAGPTEDDLASLFSAFD